MIEFFKELFSQITALSGSIDWFFVLRMSLLLSVAICTLGGIFRLVFGKNSKMVQSVSACISMILLYLLSIVLYVLAPALRGTFADLPFITITEESFYLWNIPNMELYELYPPVLRLFILSFFVNLMETVLPKSDKPLNWLGFRLLSVIASLGFYTALVALIRSIVPEMFEGWAQWTLLIVWIVVALVGFLKLLTSALAATNPLVAKLYGFFFAHIFGKQFSKAIITTLLSMQLFAFLRQLGFVSFYFDSFSLSVYTPACIISLVCLYLFSKLL